jgi:hypothetical protein
VGVGGHFSGTRTLGNGPGGHYGGLDPTMGIATNVHGVQGRTIQAAAHSQQEEVLRGAVIL